MRTPVTVSRESLAGTASWGVVTDGAAAVGSGVDGTDLIVGAGVVGFVFPSEQPASSASPATTVDASLMRMRLMVGRIGRGVVVTTRQRSSTL